MNDVGATEPQSWHFVQFWGSSTFGSHFYPLLIETQWGFLWQNWPPQWVVSRSGVTSVGGTFTFVQIWCRNFLAKIFFGMTKNFRGGILLHLSKSGVGIFWLKFFFGQLKYFGGGVLLHFSKNDLGIFSQLWGYQNMKTSECHETSRYAKIFDLGAFFVDHFGPQSSGWAKFGCHFNPVTPIAQGPDFYWSFIFCPSLPVPNLVLISWMM